MAKNSLFAVLLRSPWWISFAIAVAVALVASALMPREYRPVAVLSGLPFAVIGLIAVLRQSRLPRAARIEQTTQAVSAMAWPQFSGLLEEAFRRDGYAVERGRSGAVDFELERKGRRMLVSARRWKSARTGAEPLRALQDARDASDATDALYISLGELTDNARSLAAEHRIAVWQSSELAQALRGVPLPAQPLKR